MMQFLFQPFSCVSHQLIRCLILDYRAVCPNQQVHLTICVKPQARTISLSVDLMQNLARTGEVTANDTTHIRCC